MTCSYLTVLPLPPQTRLHLWQVSAPFGRVTTLIQFAGPAAPFGETFEWCTLLLHALLKAEGISADTHTITAKSDGTEYTYLLLRSFDDFKDIQRTIQKFFPSTEVTRKKGKVRYCALPIVTKSPPQPDLVFEQTLRAALHNSPDSLPDRQNH